MPPAPTTGNPTGAFSAIVPGLHWVLAWSPVPVDEPVPPFPTMLAGIGAANPPPAPSDAPLAASAASAFSCMHIQHTVRNVVLLTPPERLGDDFFLPPDSLSVCSSNMLRWSEETPPAPRGISTPVPFRITSNAMHFVCPHTPQRGQAMISPDGHGAPASPLQPGLRGRVEKPPLGRRRTRRTERTLVQTHWNTCTSSSPCLLAAAIPALL